LPPGQPFSAHPLKDPITGDIFSIGVDLQFNLNVYHLNAAGRFLQQRKIKLDQVPFCHSFCLAGPYLIFFLPPITLEQFPLLLNQKPYADALGWNPSGSTRILIVDRDSLEIVSQGETDPWFQWHYGNGCVLPDGNVRLDFVHFSDFIQTNEYLREVPTGMTTTPSHGHLWQVILNPQTAQILAKTPIIERSCEFPVINPHLTGQPWRYTYVALQRQGEKSEGEWFGAIARVDYQTDQMLEADLGPNKYPVEPLYIPHPSHPDQGWIITVVYDGDTHHSEVWLWDQAHLDQDPVCRLGLPSVVPFSFHGTWRSTV
jgi:carotenoid cleavage dioxygenase-like enzyme